MCEEKEFKKRRIIFQFETLKMTFDTPYISDEACEKLVKMQAELHKMPAEHVLVYNLGTEDQDEDGTMFFCPKCGNYNEYGWDPTVNMFYRRTKEGGELTKAGYYKYVPIDCDNCGSFEVNCDKFEKEMDKMNEEFFNNEVHRSEGTIEESSE